ncbi:hypothetical protein [Paenibacillus glycanilyticus]|uniref:Uncharacterized protein n=1 Tax=Paenibacillus glycanilyticus TaxID=126569 RepID=A0ABQ6GLV0_9BACL|nr:hypothetical protein [Paenibacillus glycanilyticus]GLX70353.1 hypothetical protein MU1_46990 [Paenibacillus glycanilyticus]
MGSSFTNIQLKAVETYTHQQICQAITELMGRSLFERVEEPGDRSIVISWDGTSPWVAIYDQFSDEGDQEMLDAMAGSLAEKLRTCAVSNAVFDSDLLLMRLFDQGKAVDLFVNDIDMYNEYSNQKRKRQGVPSKWASLREGTTKEEITGIWQGEPVFAEDTLWELSALYGWNTDRSCTGFRYKQSDGWLEGDIVLHFKDNNPADELFEESSSLTQLELSSYQPYVDCTTKSEASVYFYYVNTGQAAAGLTITMWGSAISDDCLGSMEATVIMQDGTRLIGQLEDIQLHYPDQPEHHFPGKILRFDEAMLPGGVTLLREAATPVEMSQLMERNGQSRIMMKYLCKPVRGGVYDWHFAVRPNTAPQNGVVHGTKLFIDIPFEEAKALKKEHGFYE